MICVNRIPVMPKAVRYIVLTVSGGFAVYDLKMKGFLDGATRTVFRFRQTAQELAQYMNRA